MVISGTGPETGSALWIVKFLIANFREVIAPSLEDGRWISKESVGLILYVLNMISVLSDLTMCFGQADVIV